MKELKGDGKKKISPDQLLTLNDKVLQHSGKIEESFELEKCVMNLQESNGCSVTVSDPSPNYMKKIITVLGVQEGISLVTQRALTHRVHEDKRLVLP